MTDNEQRRYAIFKQYSSHLQFLRDNGLLKIDLEYAETYICPVCIRQFSEEALDQKSENPLTLEDAPPKSLGGKAYLLTCRACNNIAGQQIDWHLTVRMNELDQQEFVAGVSFHPEFDNNGVIVQGAIMVGEDGDIAVKHVEKKNNPEKLKTYVATTGADDIINIKFRESKVDVLRLQIALLKTAYLLVFAKFGYSFLLDPAYDRIREQLRNPDVTTYPMDFWFISEDYKPHQGVPFITGQGVEGIFPIFVLNTGLKERTFSCILPLVNKPIEDLLAQVKAIFKQDNGFYSSMDAMSNADYLFDDHAISKMLSWIYNINW